MFRPVKKMPNSGPSEFYSSVAYKPKKLTNLTPAQKLNNLTLGQNPNNLTPEQLRRLKQFAKYKNLKQLAKIISKVKKIPPNKRENKIQQLTQKKNYEKDFKTKKKTVRFFI